MEIVSEAKVQEAKVTVFGGGRRGTLWRGVPASTSLWGGRAAPTDGSASSQAPGNTSSGGKVATSSTWLLPASLPQLASPGWSPGQACPRPWGQELPTKGKDPPGWADA